MGRFYWVGWVLLLAIGFVLNTADAASLQEDYKGLEAKRRDLEAQRREYEKRLDTLTEELNAVADNLNDCVYQSRLKTLNLRKSQIYQNWRMIWESRLKEAEIARRSTEEVRRDLIQLWRDLEKVREDFEKRRQEIERSHTAKGPGSEYEKAFREYMAEMREQYFKRIREDLFTGYDEYLNGAEGYRMFLKSSLDLCQKNEFGIPEMMIKKGKGQPAGNGQKP